MVPLLRQILGRTIAEDIVGVQPMTEVTTEAAAIELYGQYPGRTEAAWARLEHLFEKYKDFDVENEIVEALSAQIDVTPPQAVESPARFEILKDGSWVVAPMEKVEVKPFTIHLPGIVKAERPRALITASEQPSALRDES